MCRTPYDKCLRNGSVELLSALFFSFRIFRLGIQHLELFGHRANCGRWAVEQAHVQGPHQHVSDKSGIYVRSPKLFLRPSAQQKHNKTPRGRGKAQQPQNMGIQPVVFGDGSVAGKPAITPDSIFGQNPPRLGPKLLHVRRCAEFWAARITARPRANANCQRSNIAFGGQSFRRRRPGARTCRIAPRKKPPHHTEKRSPKGIRSRACIAPSPPPAGRRRTPSPARSASKMSRRCRPPARSSPAAGRPRDRPGTQPACTPRRPHDLRRRHGQ